MHVFNEVTKRMEATDKKCLYCNRFKSKRTEDNYFLSLYNVKDRTELIVYSSVRFQQLVIEIPRCEYCKTVQSVYKHKTALYAWSLAGSIFILSLVLFGLWGFFSLLLCPLIVLVGAESVQKKLMLKRGVLAEKEGAYSSSTVQELVVRGWGITRPL